MELHQLRYFVAVAHAGSFSRAAEQCHVSQPSLSQQIGKLERRLGQRLFDRLGRRVVLTNAGQLLLDKADQIVAAVEDVEKTLRDAKGMNGGRLAVGTIPTVAPYLLPEVLAKFSAACPAAELTVHEDVTTHLLAEVAAGDLDLALLALPLSENRVRIRPLFTERLLLALPAGHPLSRRRRITIADLHQERFILLNEMHCLGEQIISFCRANACQPHIACRSAQIPTVQALIATGQGVSLLPEMACRDGRDHGIVYKTLAGQQPKRTIAAVWRQGRYRSPLAERFVELVATGQP